MFLQFVVTLAILALVTRSSFASIVFSETFESEEIFSPDGKWVLSTQSKYVGQPVKVLPTGEHLPGLENDLGLQFTQEMKHYGLATPFPEPIKMKGKDLFIQYEVKFLETFTCGGAYIKLLRDDLSSLDQLDSSTPYSIMFGPDKCGATNKVHFIVQYQSPVDKSWEEKHFNETIPVRSDKNTHLYTLAIHPDSSFEISVDNKQLKTGNLLISMEPPINPKVMIPDPNDKKPMSWVDEVEIDDPNAVKPDDWDDLQPRKIPDPNAKKPEGWLDGEPEEIPNPDIQKPEDWDDEQDGEWEAPLIPNPACEKAGCGIWKPPMIDNPLYRGKWTPPKIPNPAYIGPWQPRKIPNPKLFRDDNPVDNLPDMTALAIEIWTTNSGIHFDNFIVTHSKGSLDEFTAQTWKPKHAIEKAASKKDSSEERQKERERIYREGTIKEKVEAFVVQVVEYFSENPQIAATTALAIIVPFVYLVLFGGKPTKLENEVASEEEKEEKSTEEKEKNEEDENKETSEKSSEKEEDDDEDGEKETTEGKDN